MHTNGNQDIITPNRSKDLKKEENNNKKKTMNSFFLLAVSFLPV